LPSGTILIRTWHLGDDQPDLAKPPAWLEDFGRAWDRPHDPVLVYGRVKAGHEDDARELLGMKP
jgi:hypothetical protein